MKRLTIILFVLAILISGCGGGIPADPTATTTKPPPPTNTPVPSNTPTPLPTQTPTPTDTPVPTDTPTPTPDLKATEAAQATADAEVTQAALAAEVAKEIESYSIPTDQGSLVFFSEGGIPITIDQYDSSNVILLNPGVSYENYVLHADVSWESTSGLAGCGIIFHADTSETGAYYNFRALRLSGVPAWAVLYIEDGQLKFMPTGDVRTNNAIDLKQNSLNSYVLVVEEKLLTVYANEKRLGAVDITKQTSGEIAFEVFQESGVTTCTLDRIWVWSLR